MLKANETIILGSCYELFEDCILDIEGIVNWAKSEEYTDITLEGHNYGCNKVIYYYSQRNISEIKKIILLAPCDIPKEVEIYLGDSYEKCTLEATNLVNQNKGNELVDFPIFLNEKISAKTFYTNFSYDSSCDFFRYREKNKKSKILNDIEIPVIVIFGDKDDYVLTQDKEIVIKYLNDNIDDCTINVIGYTGHDYSGKYSELSKFIDKII